MNEFVFLFIPFSKYCIERNLIFTKTKKKKFEVERQNDETRQEKIVQNEQRKRTKEKEKMIDAMIWRFELDHVDHFYLNESTLEMPKDDRSARLSFIGHKS